MGGRRRGERSLPFSEGHGAEWHPVSSARGPRSNVKPQQSANVECVCVCVCLCGKLVTTPRHSATHKAECCLRRRRRHKGTFPGFYFSLFFFLFFLRHFHLNLNNRLCSCSPGRTGDAAMAAAATDCTVYLQSASKRCRSF